MKKIIDKMTSINIFPKVKLFLALSLEILIACNTSSFEKNYRQGLECFEKKQYNESVEYFNKAIDKKNDNPDIYVNRGVAKNYMKDFEGALRDFDIAIKLTPNNSRYFVNRGYAKENSGNIDGALKDYNSAILLDSANAEAYNNRGL